MTATDFRPSTNFIFQTIFMLRLLDQILGPLTRQSRREDEPCRIQPLARRFR